MNIDMESNEMQLRPLMCEVCLLKQTDTRTTRRHLAYCVFIAYNIILISVTFATLWSVFDLNERLHRTESIVGNLQLQRARPEGSHVDIFGHAFSEQIPVNDAEYGLKGGIQPDNNVESVRRRWNRSASRRRGKKRCKSDAERSRRTRTASAITPHFYLHGSGTSALDGKFKWKWPENRAFDRHDDFRAQPSDDNTITEVQIIKPGIYALFAKVTANGRQTHDSSVLPPVGIILKKRCNDDRDSPEDLEEAWTTQDERGVLYGALSGAYHLRDRYPLDTLVIVGLHSLRTNDLIYIQRPAEVPYDPSNPHDRYINDEKKAQFGVFLVEPCQTC